jgi:hypothetical protein
MELRQEDFELNNDQKRRMWIVDDFYKDPYKVREMALQTNLQPNIQYYKGLRSSEVYRTEEMKQVFESIMGVKINNWHYPINGCFQITTSSDPQVYHFDQQTWAAMIYLTPEAPIQSGTRLHRHKRTGISHGSHPESWKAFVNGYFDSTEYDISAEAGNIFNRLVIMDAKHIHSAGPYFGANNLTSRLVQLFFFD